MIIAGKLNCRIALYRLAADTWTPTLLAHTWASIRTRAPAAPDDVSVEAAPAGLRSPVTVEIRMRARADVKARDYAIWDSRLFYLYSLRDPDGKGLELMASAWELVGTAATYTPAGGGSVAVATRCFVVPDAPFIDEHKQVVVYRTRLELPLFEVGRAKKGDAVSVGGVDYTVLGLADGGDDGVVRALWAMPS